MSDGEKRPCLDFSSRRETGVCCELSTVHAEVGIPLPRHWRPGTGNKGIGFLGWVGYQKLDVRAARVVSTYLCSPWFAPAGAYANRSRKGNPMAVADFIFNAYSSRPRSRSLSLSVSPPLHTVLAVAEGSRASLEYLEKAQGNIESGGELLRNRLRRR